MLRRPGRMPRPRVPGFPRHKQQVRQRCARALMDVSAGGAPGASRTRDLLLSERLINRAGLVGLLGLRWRARAPMIPMCDDQKYTWARACPGYAPGRVSPGLSQRPDRCPVAGDGCVPARRAARPAGAAADLAPAADHRGDLVPGPHRLRLAVSAIGLPALADRLWLLRHLARRWDPGSPARSAANPGQARGWAPAP